MAWGKTEEAIATYQQHVTEKKEINKKAMALLNSRMKKIIGADVNMMSMVFAHSMFYRFCYHRKDLKQQTVMLLLIMRMYRVFFKTDLLIWGICRSLTGAWKMTNLAMEQGYIERIFIPPHKGVFFISAKGQELLKEFDKYYKARLKEILKDNDTGNLEARYRHMRKKYRRPTQSSYKSA